MDLNLNFQVSLTGINCMVTGGAGFAGVQKYDWLIGSILQE
jgi:hypothetical protein